MTRRLVQSHFDRPRLKKPNNYWLITQISKKGYEIVSFIYWSQVIDYFNNYVMKSNQVKIKYFGK